MKAMLLAAGRGSRLRPLTDKTPKPLVKVGESCLIEYVILRLQRAGITDVVINVAYLASQIVRFLGNGSRYGVKIEYSYEGDACLGTGGGILRALTLLGRDPFWLLSSDVYTEFTSFEHRLKQDEQAHLVMVPNPDFHPQGDYGLTAQGVVSQSAPKLTYSGIALLDPMLFDCCEKDCFSLSPLLNLAIGRGCVTGEAYHGKWFNVGTRRELALLQGYLASAQP